MSGTTRCTTLRGHKGPIVSVQPCVENALLVSSSDDGSVRLWDLREKHTALKLFKVPDSTGEMGFCRIKEKLLVVSSGATLFGYDIRSTPSVIVTTPSLSHSLCDSDNEINDFCIGHDSIAIPLDSGDVSKIDITSFQLKDSQSIHSNISAVVRYLPTGRNLVSGGYDCNLSTMKSDPSLRLDQRVAASSLMITQQGDENPSQSINPPFVVSIEVGPSDDKLAIGCGDGSVIVSDLKKGGSRIETRRSAWGGSEIHSVSVASLAWDGDTVWSVGNDSVLINMAETNINVRYKLAFKPNTVSSIGHGKVVVAGLQNEIEILDFS
jgi:WD40 repeat protein